VKPVDHYGQPVLLAELYSVPGSSGVGLQLAVTNDPDNEAAALALIDWLQEAGLTEASAAAQVANVRQASRDSRDMMRAKTIVFEPSPIGLQVVRALHTACGFPTDAFELRIVPGDFSPRVWVMLDGDCVQVRPDSMLFWGHEEIESERRRLLRRCWLEVGATRVLAVAQAVAGQGDGL